MHSGDSFGYRFENGGKAVVYTTDSEHKLENRAQTERFVRFFHEADVVIFDAMYSLADAISVKADWGHSSNIIGVELCQMARARHLVLFHHEPAYDDAAIESVLRETRRFEQLTRGTLPLQVSAAYDGLELDA
jgi:ribonuclease BN (tRNA processing enzyme)